MKLLLIDTEVEYIELVNSVQPDVDIIYFNQFESTLLGISNEIIEKGKVYEDIGIVQHAGKEPILFQLWQEADPSGNSENSYNKLRDWLVTLKEKVGLARLDLFACSLLSTQKIRDIILRLETDSGVDLRASSNDTGNSEAGGDWIMESDNVDIRNKYFTDEIKNLEFVLNFFDNTHSYGFNAYDNNQDVNGNPVSNYLEADLCGNFLSYNMNDATGEFVPSKLYELRANPSGTSYSPTLISDNASSIRIVSKVTDKWGSGYYDGQVFVSKANNRVIVMDDDYEDSIDIDKGASEYDPYGKRDGANNTYLDFASQKQLHVVYNRTYPYTNVKKYFTLSNRMQTVIAILKNDNQLYFYTKPIYSQESGNRQLNANIRYIHKIKDVRDVFPAARSFFVTLLNSNKIRRFTIKNDYRNEFTTVESLVGDEFLQCYYMHTNNFCPYIQPEIFNITNPPFIRSVIPLRRTFYDDNDGRFLVLFSNGEVFRSDQGIEQIPRTESNGVYTNVNTTNVSSDTTIIANPQIFRIPVNENINRIYSSADGWIIITNDGFRIGIGYGEHRYTDFSKGYFNDLTGIDLAGQKQPIDFNINRGFASYVVSSYFASCIVHSPNVMNKGFAINIEVKGKEDFGGKNENMATGRLVVFNGIIQSAIVSSTLFSSKLPRLPPGEAPIRQVVATNKAFAALTNTGKIFCWGHQDYGGIVHESDSSTIACYTNARLWFNTTNAPFIKLYSNFRYFFALNSLGSVFCWGGSTNVFKKVVTIYNHATNSNIKAVDLFPFHLGVTILLENGTIIYRYIYPDNTKIGTISYNDDIIFNYSGQGAVNAGTIITTNAIEGNLNGITQSGFVPYFINPSMKYTTRFLQLYQFPSLIAGTRIRMQGGTFTSIQNIKIGEFVNTANGANIRVKNIIKLNTNLIGNTSAEYANQVTSQLKFHTSTLEKVRENVYKNITDTSVQKSSLGGGDAANVFYQLFLEENPYNNDLVVRTSTGTTDYIIKSYCNFSNYVADDKIGGNKRLNAKYNEYITA